MVFPLPQVILSAPQVKLMEANVYGLWSTYCGPGIEPNAFTELLQGRTQVELPYCHLADERTEACPQLQSSKGQSETS